MPAKGEGGDTVPSSLITPKKKQANSFVTEQKQTEKEKARTEDTTVGASETTWDAAKAAWQKAGFDLSTLREQECQRARVVVMRQRGQEIFAIKVGTVQQVQVTRRAFLEQTADVSETLRALSARGATKEELSAVKLALW